jgi:hypothetical protein
MKETLMAVLAIAGIPAAITAPLWANPRGLGLALAIVGWAAYAYFGLGHVILFWDMVRRPVAKRPWIMGGPTNPSLPRDADEHIA